MPIPYNKIRVDVDLDALVHNWRYLNQRGGAAVPVVKSDAYGHGLKETVRALEKAGADTFAVGTVEEGAYLRSTGCTGAIIALLGPIDRWEYESCWSQSIVPFIGNYEQLAGMDEASRKAGESMDIILKFDTGMSRLGFRESGLDKLASTLAEMPKIRPIMAASHLATADDPGQTEYVSAQESGFNRIVEGLKTRGVEVQGCLANSAGILAHGGCLHHVQRAGIALYGVNPFHGTDWEDKGAGLKPAMEVRAPILEVRTLSEGESISYGRTHVAGKETRAAVVAVGYADAYSRSLSNTGFMLVQGRRVPIIGRVCMQMTAVDVTGLDGVSVGDSAVLLGGEGEERISAEELAQWWGTIPYEAFCLLGLNRRYYSGL